MQTITLQQQVKKINDLRNHYKNDLISNETYQLFASVSESLQTLKSHLGTKDGVLVHMSMDTYKEFMNYQRVKKVLEYDQQH